MNQAFDLVLLSCKAYDLEGAIASFAPAVGSGTLILPLLNGLRHLDRLDQSFGAANVLGGRCVIHASLDQDGTVVHAGGLASITFGERHGGITERIRAVLSAMQGTVFDARASEAILLDMWEKWVFLASLAGSTTLMRATIGDICSTPDGRSFVLGVIQECRRIAELEGNGPRPAFLEEISAQLTAAASPLTASRYRDMQRNGPIEADHIIGDLLQRGQRYHAAQSGFPLLRLTYANLKTYEKKRARTGGIS